MEEVVNTGLLGIAKNQGARFTRRGLRAALAAGVTEVGAVAGAAAHATASAPVAVMAERRRNCRRDTVCSDTFREFIRLSLLVIRVIQMVR